MDSQPQSCKGKTKDGDPCTCLRHIPRADQDPNAPHLCRDCGHPESSHPSTSSIASILSSYRDPLKLGTKLKTSADAAIKETNTGLKRLATIEASGSGSSKKKAKVTALGPGPGDELKVKEIPIGWAVVIPDGLARDKNGNLNEASAPRPNSLFTQETWKLAVSANDSSSTLTFRPDWDVAQVDDWSRMLFPEVFNFLDSHNPHADQRPWTLLLKMNKSLMKYPKEPSGQGLDACKGGKGRTWKDRIIHIATNIELPFALYTNEWKETSDTSSEAEGGPEDAPGEDALFLPEDSPPAGPTPGYYITFAIKARTPSHRSQ
ncbi:hypothetical protein NEOLEDRAFT_1183597 [Neolentinus lepideus HHB14362 ss-1]|uniref:Uncharacterized protein n=1 Tax=Neolentinus lepideus HHB14362 ss-1 TaxID=1314782 RepID=A0A165N404_9AGAM|nr:hypothetical protein NEOLEDRAFT_1183597 [Neolentinus lepideus HHB14362 ss-1]